jgi:uncharacterized protein
VKIFFDSSALAKRYISEPGSEKVNALCKEASQVAASLICVPEIISTFARLKRELKLTSIQYKQGKQALLEDIADITICLLTPAVIKTSLGVIETSPVRAMDALHVACALEWQTELFVSADQRQLTAAKKSGLKILTIS